MRKSRPPFPPNYPWEADQKQVGGWHISFLILKQTQTHQPPTQYTPKRLTMFSCNPNKTNHVMSTSTNLKHITRSSSSPTTPWHSCPTCSQEAHSQWIPPIPTRGHQQKKSGFPRPSSIFDGQNVHQHDPRDLLYTTVWLFRRNLTKSEQAPCLPMEARYSGHPNSLLAPNRVG